MGPHISACHEADACDNVVLPRYPDRCTDGTPPASTSSHSLCYEHVANLVTIASTYTHCSMAQPAVNVAHEEWHKPRAIAR